jgi:hypothetical protein
VKRTWRCIGEAVTAVEQPSALAWPPPTPSLAAQWEQYRRENPEAYEHNFKNKRALDPSNPDDLFVAIGKCNPS